MRCVFCEIIQGNLDSSIVYEDNHTIAIMDINPINHGHVLVMPKKHAEMLNELKEEDVRKLFSIVSKLEKALWEIEDILCEGTNILQNNGRAAWQEVNHIHIHIIPRFKGDNFKIIFSSLKPDRNNLEKLAHSLNIKMSNVLE